MVDSKATHARAKNAKPPKEPRNLWLRVRVSADELGELKLLGDHGDFATNIRQILLDRARGERTKILNARELLRFQLYLVIDRQARLIREQHKVAAHEPLGILLQAVEKLGKVTEDGNVGSTLE